MSGSTHNNQTPADGIRVSNAILDLAFGDPANGKLKGDALKADLKESGIDLDKAIEKARSRANDARNRLSLEEARRARLAAQASAPPRQDSTNDSRESLVAQILNLISLNPTSGVYARKWEQENMGDLISLRDSLAKTHARELARKNG